MENSIAFEAKLKRLFTALGVHSDSELARALGITPPSVASAKQKRQMPIGWIEKVSNISNFSMDWLYSGKGPMRLGENGTITRLLDEPELPPYVCARCMKLEEKLERVEEERRDLSLENRQLWRENGHLRERVAQLEGQLSKTSTGTLLL